MEFTEKALVLKVGRFRENDVWLRLFCAGRGVISAFAFGGSKSRRRFCGCLDPLALASFRVELSRRGSYNVLQEGVLLHAHPGLRADARKLGMVAHCLKFVEAVQLGPDGARPVFDLLLETLSTLEAHSVGAEMLPLLFKAKLTFEQGLKPDLSLCVRCGRPVLEHEDSLAASALFKDDGREFSRRLAFSVERGGLVCGLCGDCPAETLSTGSARVLEWIGQSRPADWPRLALEPEMRRELSRVVDRFVAWHLGLRWENGTYRKI
ncbi:DNA replication and repair protein RecO [Humidesulfovibrio mexicanus]|uniref:DNA repair protein RecO n=1 Tax=Humidesulfovibrio mexicanus TaxID=147047 RepID=A0A238XXL9_9BACT|nr:DNA repair protein RecO [Humidesulfovibrio mexicanus]SNR63261.1 DNA replication and repair protein RecO [Humidesulfovibrio mexicanus]